MDTEKKLPIGIENFEKILTEGFYYVDKTGLIKDLLDNWSKVTVFTRPRRFGKSLNMNMLRAFFEIGTDKALFEGLRISEDTALCETYMGQFPVIYISLKSVIGCSFEEALENIGDLIQTEARRLQFLLNSGQLTEIDKIPLSGLYEQEITQRAQRGSLRILSEMLFKHYGKKVIILIDEYDVPLDKSYENGYYDKMVLHLRSLFEQALKTNDYLQFAVVTGCMRISKESIFTGLNNFNVQTISDVHFAEYFGFTDSEVREMLEYYGLSSYFDTVKEWYNGYHFGNTEVYCPWDVINYCYRLRGNPEEKPAAYWANTSGNAIVRRIIEQSTGTSRNQIEMLLAGDSVEMEIVPELTYKDLDTEESGELLTYLWSMLFTTGYLTERAGGADGKRRLVIPNLEIQQIFEKQIKGWFAKLVQSDRIRLQEFHLAVRVGDALKVQEYFEDYLQRSIGIQDTRGRNARKENFYHGILLGLLGSEESWIVKSNQESGDGYSDILVEIPTEKTGCVFEMKYAESGSFEPACDEAMRQIEDRKYSTVLRFDGMETIHAYGVACFKKGCKVSYRKLNTNV